jgi:hypothetical protein
MNIEQMKLVLKEIITKTDLSDLLYKYKKGDKIELTIMKNEVAAKIPVQL